MPNKYQILSFIPAFGISREMLSHQWVCCKIANFLIRKVLLQRVVVWKILSMQKNLHRKTEFHDIRSEDGLFISVEYVCDPIHFVFRVKSFLAIYE